MTLSLSLRYQRGDFVLNLDNEWAGNGVLGVLGASGAGKSTLLRAIAGLDDDVQGNILWRDQCWLNTSAGQYLPVHQRAIGMVFQDVRLLPHLDVAGNLNYAQTRSDTTGPEIDVDEVIDVLALSPFMNRAPVTLSGGERQRVSLARALLRRPQLLLLDEPLSAVDTTKRAELVPYLRRVFSAFSLPAVYVSHSLDELASLADDFWIMRHGQVIASGETTSILSRLDINELNEGAESGSVLRVSVVEHLEQYGLTQVALGDQPLWLPAFSANLDSERRVLVHARDISLALERPQGISIRNVLAGTIVEMADHNDGVSVDVLVSVGASVLRSRITRASRDELALTQGRPIFALVKSVSLAD